MNRIRICPAFAAVAAAGLLWGLGFVFGKIALERMPVGAMVSWRFAVASIVLLPFLFGRRARRSTRRQRSCR